MRDKIICGFLQEKLLDFKGVRYETRKKKIKGKETSYKKEIEIKLDVSDAHILQKVSKFMMNPRGNAMFDDRIFTIIKYEIIVENLPLLNLTVKGLRERFKKYVILGTLEMEMKKHPKTGTKTYYSLSEKLYNCIDGAVSTEELSTVSEESLSTVSEESLSTVSDKHYNKHLENTTTEKSKKPSSSLLVNTFKKHNFKISELNIKNIEKLNLQESTIEEYLKYTISQKKGIGYLIKALKENWDIKEPEDKTPRAKKIIGVTHKIDKSGVVVEKGVINNIKELTELDKLKGEISKNLMKWKKLDLFSKLELVNTVAQANKFVKENNIEI